MAHLMLSIEHSYYHYKDIGLFNQYLHSCDKLVTIVMMAVAYCSLTVACGSSHRCVFLMFTHPKMSDLDDTNLYRSKLCH